MTETEQAIALWPEDSPGEPGPDFELACVLLAAGQAQDFIRDRCGFESRRQCAAFCRDDETRARVAELVSERAKGVGKRALVNLEKILIAKCADGEGDLRAHVLAIRTALEVSGDLRNAHSAPVKQVRELTVGELNELIAATKSELDKRIGSYRADKSASRAKVSVEPGP